MGDRPLLVSLGISTGLHLMMLIGRLAPFPHEARATSAPLEVVYETPRISQPLRTVQEQLSRTQREAGILSSAGGPGGFGQHADVRIPERPLMVTNRPLLESVPGSGSSPIIDLNDLTRSVSGNPVLFQYFSVIREQIERSASGRSWVIEQGQQGIVCVAFVLTAEGALQNVHVVGDRSIPSDALWAVALRIVGAAAPFPPFPPSIKETSKTVVIPLEFVVSP